MQQYRLVGKHPSGKGHILKPLVKSEWICFDCRKDINKQDFFYCKNKDVLFCKYCAIYEHKVVIEHTDWHIIEIQED